MTNPTDTIQRQLSQSFSMTMKGTSAATGFSRDTLYDLLRAGEIQGFLMGNRRYIETGSVREYLARRVSEPLTIRRSPKSRTGSGSRSPRETRPEADENRGG